MPEDLLARPFLVREALDRGVGRQVLRGRRFRAPWIGVRVPAQLPDDLRTRCAALALLIPEATFSHATAAQLMRLWMPVGWCDTTLHLSVTAATAPRRLGVVAHRATWEPGDLLDQGRESLTSPARTLCDLAAANWELTDLVAIADSIQRRRLASVDELRARVLAWPPAPGARTLRQVLALTRPGVDSAMETRLRLALARAGLPEPQVNRTIRDVNGEYLHKPDLSWPEYKVAADYDGAHHLVNDPRRRRIDIARKEDLEEAGWLLRVLTSADVLQYPDRAVDRVRRALRERGAPV